MYCIFDTDFYIKRGETEKRVNRITSKVKKGERDPNDKVDRGK